MRNQWTIGRAPDCQIIVDHPHVSRWHARIRRVGGGLVIEDLGSGAGTTLNGDAVRGQTPIRPGDVIRLGSVSLATGMEPLRTILASASPPGRAAPRPWAASGYGRLGLGGALLAMVVLAWGLGRSSGDTTAPDRPAVETPSPAGAVAKEVRIPRWAFEAIFMVGIERGGTVEPIGTGFVPAGHRVIVTNAHVAAPIVEHCLRRHRCRGVAIGNEHPDRRFTIRRIIVHPGVEGAVGEFVPDLAILIVDRPEVLPNGLPLAAPAAVNNATLQGKRAAIIGFPGQTMNPADPVATVDWGTVGRVVRQDWIQFSAESTPGNSGSPVLVPGPAVIGVNYAGLGIRAVVTLNAETGKPTVERIQQGGGLNLAVGARLLRAFLAASD